MEVIGDVNITLTLKGRGRATRYLSAYTTPAVFSPASGTTWQNDPARSKKYTVHLLFICTQLPVAYSEPQARSRISEIYMLKTLFGLYVSQTAME